MPVIVSFVDPSGIVENGKKLNYFDFRTRDLCQPQPVFQNPCPMTNSVGAVPGQRIIFEDSLDEGLEVDHSPNVLCVPSQ